MKLFTDRVAAGRELGARLRRVGLHGDLLVLGLPRGGVPVACEVAAALDAPVDVLVVRKLGAPFNSELAVGAIACGGVTVLNESVLAGFGLHEESIEPVIARERVELLRRERAYRGGKPPLEIAGKTVILVDDGMATGATMHAAVVAARELAPARIVVAVPTSAQDSVVRLERVADEVVALATPEPYYGVGAWYDDFPQLSDAEVVSCLARAAERCEERRASAGGGECMSEHRGNPV